MSLLIIAASPAQSLAPNAILRKVDDHYNHLSTLRAGYTQHYSGLGLDRTETGTLLLKKPGRMRWNYTTPVGKVFLLDGKFGWFYTPGDSQATRVATKKLDDMRSPLRFLLGHTQLSKELENIAITSDSSSYKVSGIPKGMTQRIKLLTLTIAASGEIKVMRLEELDGSTTEFSFTRMQENISIKDADFVFIPPAGVAVVDGLAPI